MLDWTNFSILLQNNHHPMLWLIWWDDGSSWQYTTDEYSKRIRLRISNNGWKMSCESTTAFSFHGGECYYWNKYVRVTKHWIELIASIIEWCMLYQTFLFKVHYIHHSSYQCLGKYIVPKTLFFDQIFAVSRRFCVTHAYRQ